MRRSLRHGAGYLIVDHSASPGLTPADVAGVPGAVAVPGGATFERDLIACSHCERVIKLDPTRTRERGHCPKCDHYVCDWCNAMRIKTGECLPMDKVLDLAQRHYEHFIGREDHPQALTPDVLLTETFMSTD